MKEVFIIAITYYDEFDHQFSAYYQSSFLPNITAHKRQADKFTNYPSIQNKIEELVKGDTEERMYSIEKYFVKE